MDQDSSSDSEEDQEIVQIDFEFCSPKEIDFHSTKMLLRQLFGPDAIQFDLSALTDLIVGQTDIGTMIKTDTDENSDPVAFLSVIDLKEKSQCQATKKLLIDYFISKTMDYPNFNRKIRQVCSNASKDKVGLVLGDRLVNIPTEIMPPMYRLLNEEMKTASGAQPNDTINTDLSNSATTNTTKTFSNSPRQGPFDFDYLFILSRTYQEEASKLDKEDRISAKKSKTIPSKADLFSFHPEDEVLHKHALYYHSYKYSREPPSSDSKRAFYDYGVLPQGHIMLVKTSEMDELVKDLEVTIPPF